MLGETWINHHGDHGKESTRGVLNTAFKDHPILRGVTDIWGPTDVYGVIHLPADAQVLVWGQVLGGMKPTDPPVAGKKNDPMMPLAWIRNYTGESGKTSRIFTTTMGASMDLDERGIAAADRQCELLGGGTGEQNPGPEQRGLRRRIPANLFWVWQTQEGSQACRPCAEIAPFAPKPRIHGKGTPPQFGRESRP